MSETRVAKRITAYETTDGKLFTDGPEADEHQRKLDTRAFVEKQVSRFFYAGITEELVVEGILDSELAP